MANTTPPINPEIAKLTEAIAKSLERAKDSVQDLVQKFESSKEPISAVTKEIEKTNRAIQAIAEEEKKIQDLDRDRLTNIEKQKIRAESSLKTEREHLDVLKQNLQSLIDLDKLTKSKDEKEAKSAKEQLAFINKRDGNINDYAVKIEKQIKQQEAIVKKEAEHNNALKLADQNVDAIGAALGFASNINETWLGKLENTLKASTSISVTLGAYANKIFSADTASKLFEQTVSKIGESTIKMAYDMSEVESEFNKSTGTGGKFNNVINQTRLGSTAAGIGLQESAAATRALFEGMTSFTTLTTQTQGELVKTTALLDQLGISGETTAKNLDISTKSLGMTTTEAINTQKEIASEAIALGVAPQKLAGDFASAMPRLAAYGKQAISVFKELEGQAKATGLSMDQLLNITSQFDTFEGASQAAGKLNAILGGNLLNSVDLLNASEDQRIEILRRSVTESGRNFDSLSKYEQKAIAAAAGITDMTEATKLFGQSEAVFQQAKSATQAQAMATKELTEYASKSVSVHKQLDLIMQSLSGAAQPLLNVISGLLNTILKFNDATGNILLPILIGGTGLIYGLAKAIQFAAATTEALRVVGFSLGETIGVETVGTEALTAVETENTIAKEKGILSTIASVTWSGIKKVAEWAEIGVMTALALAQDAYTKIKNQGILTTIASVTWKGIETAAGWAEQAVMIALAVAQDAYDVAKQSNIITTIKDIAITGFSTISRWAAVAAQTALNVVIWLGTAAISAFGIAVAIATSPITLIVLGIGALIGGIYLLIKHFNDIGDTIQDTTGSFFDLWDVLLIMTGPIGILIEAGKKLYENWDTVVGGIKSLFSDLSSFISDVFNSVLNYISAPVNWIIEKINSVIALANHLPGINIGSISPIGSNVGATPVKALAEGITNLQGSYPETMTAMEGISTFASGETNFSGGNMALVGEKGPEMVTLPTGANVVTNENTSKLASTAANLQDSKSQIINKQSEIVNKLINNTTNTTTNNKNDNGNRTIVLQLDNRELGRAVFNIFEDKFKLNSVGV